MEQNSSNGRRSKIRTYIFYAVGEIALVMIGILLALQVNNWNEERKLKNEEYRVLTALQAEIFIGIEDLENRTIIEKDLSDLLRTLLTKGQKRDSLLSSTKIDSLMLGPLWSASAELPVLQTYNDLKSSGEISIIQNNLIRARLADLELGFNNLLIQQNDLLTVQQMRVDQIVIDKIDFISVLEASRYPGLTVESTNDYRGLLNDRKIRNALGAKLDLLQTVVDYRLKMIDDSKSLLALIDQEIQTD